MDFGRGAQRSCAPRGAKPGVQIGNGEMCAPLCFLAPSVLAPQVGCTPVHPLHPKFAPQVGVGMLGQLTAGNNNSLHIPNKFKNVENKVFFSSDFPHLFSKFSPKLRYFARIQSWRLFGSSISKKKMNTLHVLVVLYLYIKIRAH